MISHGLQFRAGGTSPDAGSSGQYNSQSHCRIGFKYVPFLSRFESNINNPRNPNQYYQLEWS
jgi:hypothetical protein